jgi:hypothetical protein
MSEIDKLATLWSIAKQREEAAKAERIGIEEEILKLHPAREEGSDTFTTDKGTRIKLTGKVTYKCDVDALILLTGSWPDDIRPIKTKVEADDTRLKAIRAERPDLWRSIAQAVETKPAKTAVEIKFAGK